MYVCRLNRIFVCEWVCVCVFESVYAWECVRGWMYGGGITCENNNSTYVSSIFVSKKHLKVNHFCTLTLKRHTYADIKGCLKHNLNIQPGALNEIVLVVYCLNWSKPYIMAILRGELKQCWTQMYLVCYRATQFLCITKTLATLSFAHLFHSDFSTSCNSLDWAMQKWNSHVRM